MFSAAVESDGLIYWPKNVPDPPPALCGGRMCLPGDQSGPFAQYDGR
jgi:hypothetical protein